MFDRVLDTSLPRISPYSVRMRENTDQNNSEYGHFLRSEYPVQEFVPIIKRSLNLL